MRNAIAVIALSSFGGAAALAQTMPPSPVLQIIRETNKEGKTAAHEKVETEWAATVRKANHPAHYVGLASISGGDEFWFIEPMTSFAQFEDWGKVSDKEPMKTVLANLNSRDGDTRASSRTLWAVFRPDMSYNPEKFSPGKTRFVEVETFRVRMGKDDDFASGGKQIMDAMHRANIDGCTIAYQVVAGAPSGTYLLFNMMQSMKELDSAPARMQAISQAMGPENFSRFMKSGGDIFVSIDTTILQVKPEISYAPQPIVNADPAFWKAAPAAPPAAKKATQQ